MKKRIIVIVLICAIAISMFLHSSIAFGDPVLLSASQVGAAALSVGSSLGIDWNMIGAGSGFAGNWIGAEVQKYDDGQSLIEYVSSSIAIDAAGKLMIAQTGYNKICEFIEWLRGKYTIDNALIGTNNIVFDPLNIAGSLNGWAPYPGGEKTGGGYYWEGWSKNGGLPGYASTPDWYTYQGMSTSYYSTFGRVIYTYNLATKQFDMLYSSMGLDSVQRQNFAYPEEYSLPTVLNPDKEWTGTIGQHSIPDTNLGDLLDGALEDVEGGNLDVDGEIIDVPVPPGPVPTWTPVDDVIDGINQGGEVITDIGNDIGDISGHLDDLGEIGGDIVGELEGVNQGIVTQTGVLSGAIDQAVSDVQDAISEQTQTLSESATATVEATESIAEALEDEAINWQKFNLRGLFPFCIPFDIYNMLQALDASPTAPHVQLPFVIESINFSYTIDLDFSAFDTVAAVMRQMELIVYGIALAWATSKVIKW